VPALPNLDQRRSGTRASLQNRDGDAERSVSEQLDGGSKLEWGATSVAIAEKVSKFGADSIEVLVNRNEIHQKQGVRFREVAHTYYSPNPQHTVWDGDKMWAIYLADPAHLATQTDENIDEDFADLDQHLIDRGMGADAADRKAGAAIAKKYHLPKDWQLWSGNISTTPSSSSPQTGLRSGI
jgi:DNA-binding protein H-NS